MSASTWMTSSPCTGPTEETHTKTLNKVLRRLNDAGVRLKREKCFLMLPSVGYLGHRISASGLQLTDGKIKALKDAPVPHNVSQLKSFLGLLNYYGKFIPKLSTLFALHRLLQKKSTWTWGPEQQGVFDCVKRILTSEQCAGPLRPLQPPHTGLCVTVRRGSGSLTQTLQWHRTAHCVCLSITGTGREEVTAG